MDLQPTHFQAPTPSPAFWHADLSRCSYQKYTKITAFEYLPETNRSPKMARNQNFLAMVATSSKFRVLLLPSLLCSAYSCGVFCCSDTWTNQLAPSISQLLHHRVNTRKLGLLSADAKQCEKEDASCVLVSVSRDAFLFLFLNFPFPRSKKIPKECGRQKRHQDFPFSWNTFPFFFLFVKFWSTGECPTKLPAETQICPTIENKSQRTIGQLVSIIVRRNKWQHFGIRACHHCEGGYALIKIASLLWWGGKCQPTQVQLCMI